MFCLETSAAAPLVLEKVNDDCSPDVVSGEDQKFYFSRTAFQDGVEANAGFSYCETAAVEEKGQFFWP